ncbi:MAG TPA: beta-propeller fold lactonase family protein [Rhizomicrobium sp.]|nr:beta-propeller fold lactonase family protein [Rhizomicrobium sp.]
MLDRRDFTALLGAACLPGIAHAAGEAVGFYASTGPRLTLYHLDRRAASLTQSGGITLPANLQYAWPHPSQKFLYVAASNSQPGGGPIGAVGTDKNHYALAFKIDPATGALTPHGERRLLPVRPVHITTDQAGAFLFIAYNNPSQVTVHRLNPDGSIGEQVTQPATLNFGIYAHQVRVTPGERSLTLCSRGNDATASKPEDPGRIEVFGLKEGRLSSLQTVTVGNGLGFGPRHLDFHPNGRFVYVSLERENSIAVFGLKPDGTMTQEPLFLKSALTDPLAKEKYPGQTVGPIHVHPNGRFVYQTNRGSGTVEVDGRKVSNGGENNVVVWAIDPRTGEPSLIQRAEAHGFELRTFSIDPEARVLIAASTTPMLLRDGSTVSAGLSVYRIGSDGKLDFARKVDVDTSAGIQFWSGFLNMP